MKNKLALSIAISLMSLVVLTTPTLAQSPKAKPTLPPARMRACEAKSSGVQTRTAHLVRMASNILEVFDSQATRVEQFYTNTVATNGKTVANYETLQQNIATKKQLVLDALGRAKKNADAFSCAGGDPKQLLLQFRLDMQATKTALKEYRVAIKNLITAVHRVTPASSPSPSPSVEAK